MHTRRLPSPYDPARLPSAAQPASVCIIGAGAAGLHAAWLLRSKGLDVSILEASGRIGGRIWTDHAFADFPVEGGAEEIHGTRSVWHAWARRSGARLVPDTLEDWYELDGRLLTARQAGRHPAVRAARAFVREAVRELRPEQPVEAFAAAAGLPPAAYPLANAWLGNEYGTDNARLSLRGIAEQEQLWRCGDESVMLADKGFLDLLLERLPVQELVQLHQPVCEIGLEPDAVWIRTESGQLHRASRAVCTVPLGVLRAGLIRFAPDLPPDKQAAIRQIGFGPGIKLMLRFRERFWPEPMASLLASGLVPEYWAASAGRGQTPVLTAFAMGAAAERISAAGAGIVLEDLDRIFGAGTASSRLEAAWLQDWGAMPYIRGAYSYPAAGGGLAAREALARPMAGRLFFAGEATSPGHQATVHGALESGYRAAEEVLRSLGA
ncbi:MAG: NAD(P)/FAD-dependent oxidoreductase [Bacteroidia bacterium]|nr:NAD(P)/FAD-dependent oxidoreductase [Bacteroidia bacterium]